uniref:START domain-containing protein n=1 Tax=Dracunculus medinensis TaxID=318479 RepID=A0A0N4U5S0_DRAME
LFPTNVGILRKWTNYVYGWQQRYFEVENGSLLYYKSENEKIFGSRGSITIRCVWELFWEEGEMKMYKRNLEIDGLVQDPLKATHLVKVHKRVWPTAQRESLFWSHTRRFNEHRDADALDLFLVCNHSCVRPDVPLKQSSNVRVGLTVAMICQTKPVEDLTRNDVSCRIIYVSRVDPGGWVPVAGLRMIYKREYPKFLRGFTEYVVKNTRSTPLIL